MIRLAGLFLIFFWLTASTVQAQTLLYVPADNRPVSLQYVVDTFQAAGATIITPPEEILAARNRWGDADRLWQWVEEHCTEADSVVLSADSMLYGGLVPSRVHDLSAEILQERVEKFVRLKTLNPFARIYVFSTVMRTPQFTAGGVEPPYYETYGYRIFRISALRDKREVQGLTKKEGLELSALEAEVPAAVMTDWQARRDKNFRVNERLIKLLQQGDLNYFILGRDDTSPFSQSHKETRYLLKLASGNEGRFSSFPGADQLGMVLLTRAVNDFYSRIPIVKVCYSPGTGPATIPSYEDQPTGKTTTDHVLAAGGIPLLTADAADIFLMVNTPVDGRTHEADSVFNSTKVSDEKKVFVSEIQSLLERGKKVAVADIAFGNGADNSFLTQMSAQGLLSGLAAYSGWNTASNTTGYAIGQGMLAALMSDNERIRLLTVRYLDDWAYQANIRSELNKEINYPMGGSLVQLDERNPLLVTTAENKFHHFAERYLPGFPTENLHVYFPWNRMFEIYVTVTP